MNNENDLLVNQMAIADVLRCVATRSSQSGEEGAAEN